MTRPSDEVKRVENDFKPNHPAVALRYFRDKMNFTTGPVELNSAREKGVEVQVVDVRDKEDFEKGHIPGSVNLPKEQWHSLRNLEHDKMNVVVCYSEVCHLAARACVYFANEGFPVMEMDGGFKAWQANGLSVEGAKPKAA